MPFLVNIIMVEQYTPQTTNHKQSLRLRVNQISKISLLLQSFRALWNSSEMKLLFSFHQILKTLNSKQEMYLFVWILFLPDTRVVCFKEGNCLQLNKGEPQNIILIKFLDWKENWNLEETRRRTTNDELELFCSSLLRETNPDMPP